MNTMIIISGIWLIVGIFNYEVMMNSSERKMEMTTPRIIFMILTSPLVTIWMILKVMFNTK